MPSTSSFIASLLILLISSFDRCFEMNLIRNIILNESSTIVVSKEDLTLRSELGMVFYDNEPYTGLSTISYSNGNLAEQTTYLKGKKNGLNQKWYSDGTLSFESHYKNNRLHGFVKSWWKNGNIRSESNYVNGNSDGLQKQWYVSGAIFKEFNIVNGKEEGLQKAWRENGKIYINYEAKNGRIFGLKRSKLCYELTEEDIQYRE